MIYDIYTVISTLPGKKYESWDSIFLNGFIYKKTNIYIYI